MSEEPKKKYTPNVQYKITLNLRGLIGSEEMVHEYEDGRKREGIFIPYEENAVYRGRKYALLNISAVVYPEHERQVSSIMALATHYLQYYWTVTQTQKMAAIGYDRDKYKIGWMEANKLRKRNYRPQRKEEDDAGRRKG